MTSDNEYLFALVFKKSFKQNPNKLNIQEQEVVCIDGKKSQMTKADSKPKRVSFSQQQSSHYQYKYIYQCASVRLRFRSTYPQFWQREVYCSGWLYTVNY